MLGGFDGVKLELLLGAEAMASFVLSGARRSKIR